jgi:hypothetical protein
VHVASLDMQDEDILQDDAWVVISAFFEEKVSIMVVDAQYVLGRMTFCLFRRAECLDGVWRSQSRAVRCAVAGTPSCALCSICISDSGPPLPVMSY